MNHKQKLNFVNSVIVPMYLRKECIWCNTQCTCNDGRFAFSAAKYMCIRCPYRPAYALLKRQDFTQPEIRSSDGLHLPHWATDANLDKSSWIYMQFTVHQTVTEADILVIFYIILVCQLDHYEWEREILINRWSWSRLLYFKDLLESISQTQNTSLLHGNQEQALLLRPQ